LLSLHQIGLIKILLYGHYFGFMPAVSSEPPVEKRQRMTVYYSGHVQGVGFRYNVKTTATGFEVTGTVRNLDDGRVELAAEGLRAELEAFREAIRDSGLAGFIRDEKVTWSDAKNECRGFEIIV
jgi:acylphosphatase